MTPPAFTPPPSNYTPLPNGGVNRDKTPDGALFHVTLKDWISGRIDLRITTLDPLHVGSGGGSVVATQKGERLVRGIVGRGKRTVDRPDGSPVIPGASLKGVIRTHVEALLGGCDMDPQPCGACPACSLFGFISGDRQQMGRLGVADASLENPADIENLGTAILPRPYGPRRNTGRRIYGPRVDMRQDVPYLVVLKGVSFIASLELVNVLPEELGAVLIALGVDGTFFPRVGGGKFGGLGRVRVVPVRAVLRGDYRRPTLDRLSGDALEQRVEGWMAGVTFRGTGTNALNTLRRVLGDPKLKRRRIGEEPPFEPPLLPVHPAASGAPPLPRLSAEERRFLLQQTRALLGKINTYNRSNASAPISTSHFGPIRRFLATNPPPGDIDLFLRLLPESPIFEYGATAREQLGRVTTSVREAIPGIKQRFGEAQLAPRLAYVVGWVQRLVQVPAASSSGSRQHGRGGRDNTRGPQRR